MGRQQAEAHRSHMRQASVGASWALGLGPSKASAPASLLSPGSPHSTRSLGVGNSGWRLLRKADRCDSAPWHGESAPSQHVLPRTGAQRRDRHLQRTLGVGGASRSSQDGWIEPQPAAHQPPQDLARPSPQPPPPSKCNGVQPPLTSFLKFTRGTPSPRQRSTHTGQAVQEAPRGCGQRRRASLEASAF